MTTTAFSAAAIPTDVQSICRVLRDRGHRAWIVGGCVRDVLMGRPVSDWDVCTDAQPEQILAAFPRAIPTGIKHGTLTVVKNKEHYEVTTLRGEGSYTDGRRPDEVRFVDDIAEDLLRRDFTVNAMAVDSSSFELVDPWGGRRDLDAKILRAVGDARARFSEDGLRVLRAARFCAQLEFELEPDTARAIPDTLETYKKVSLERVRDEWVKAMKSKQPSRAFDVMRAGGILGVTCPELLEGAGCEQNRHHVYDVWGHAMACMDACKPGDPILRIAALFHDVGKPRSRAWSDKTEDYTFYGHERIGAEMVEPICTRLRFSNDERTRITELVRQHMWHYDGWQDAAVRRWIRKVGIERLEDLYALRDADILGKGPEKSDADDFERTRALRAHVERILAEGSALTVRDLAIGGRDLMGELGLAPGRILGEILEHLLEQVIEQPDLNERGELLDRARQFVAKDVAKTV